MQDIYYELTLRSNGYLESFESFIGDRWSGAIEELDDALIVRDEQPLQWLYDELGEFAALLGERVGEKISFEREITTKQNADWVQSYKDGVTPIAVGPFYVRPSWFEADDSKIDLLLDPAMAFGTGHHPTTKNALELIAIYAKKGGSMMDVGTGSGILAIGAAKLGMNVEICDTDEVAVEQALGNFELNGASCAKSHIGSIEEGGGYDMVVANITADILLALRPLLQGATAAGGVLILSGIIERYAQEIKKAFSAFELIAERYENEWVTLAYKNNGNN